MTKGKSVPALQKKENIFLLTGENEYDVQQFRKNWEKSAQEKYGEYNVIRYDIDEKPIAELLGELLSPPFFGDGRRVFFLESFPSPPPPRPFSEKRKEEFSALINTLVELPEECVVILVSPTPDKRTSAWKTTEKIIGKVHTFPLWERNRNGLFSAQGIAQAGAWAQQKMAEYGGELSSASARFLVEYVGGNPWNIAGECQKLALFSADSGEKITSEHIKALCIPTEEMENFAFGNAVQKGDISEIIQLFEQLIATEGSPVAVFARDILTTFRTLLLSRIAGDENLSAEEVGIHPFVFQRSREVSKQFSKNDLLALQNTLRRIDQEMKNGLLPVTPEKTALFQLEIERALLELFQRLPKDSLQSS